MVTEFKYQSNDYNIESILIENYNSSKLIDITEMVNNFSVYEDLFSFGMTCEINITDSIGFMEYFPIIGDENIIINTQTFGEIFKDFNFRVYAIKSSSAFNDRTQNYSLSCVSHETITSLSRKISRSYSAMKISDMVNAIYNNYITLKFEKSLDIEPTKYIHSYIVPNISPYKAINILSKRAISNSHNGSSYVFYEDSNGYKFVSLESLISKEPKYRYSYKILKNNEYMNVDKINSFTSVDSHNTLHSLSNGIYASKLITYDHIRKRIYNNTFDYDKHYDKFKHLGSRKGYYDKSSLLRNFDSNVVISPTNKEHNLDSNITSRMTVFPENIENTLLQRNSYLNDLLNSSKFLIKVAGNLDIHVGELLEIVLPSKIVENEGEEDEMHSGNYIITSVKHKFTKKDYVTEMEICKGGTEKKL